MQSVFTVEKNWALSVDQCRMQVLKFSVYLTNVLSILLRCNGFPRIQKAVVDFRPAANYQTVTMTFSGCMFGLGKCFGAYSQSIHWVGSHQLSYTIHFSSHITIWLRNGSFLLCRIIRHFNNFLICSQHIRYALNKLFHLSNLLQKLNDHRIVKVQFFGNFSGSSSISFDGRSALMISIGWCQLLKAGHCARHLQGSRFLCKTWTATALQAY